MSVFIALYWHLWPTLNPSLSPAATRCMWRRSPLRWRRTVGPYPIWQVSHTVCRCRAMSLRRIFLPRNWSRTKPREQREDTVTPIPHWCMWKRKELQYTYEKREKKNVFCCFFLRNCKNTKDHIEKLQTGLVDLRYFSDAKTRLWSTASFLCVTPLDVYTPIQHTNTLTCPIILPGQVSLCVETLRGSDALFSSPQHSLFSQAAWQAVLHGEDIQVMCEWERHTQNHLYIYTLISIWSSHQGLWSIYPPCQSLFIFFEIIAWFQDWKGWKSAFWRLPPILLPSRLLPEPSAWLTWRRWHGPSPCPLFYPHPPHQDT